MILSPTTRPSKSLRRSRLLVVGVRSNKNAPHKTRPIRRISDAERKGIKGIRHLPQLSKTTRSTDQTKPQEADVMDLLVVRCHARYGRHRPRISTNGDRDMPRTGQRGSLPKMRQADGCKTLRLPVAAAAELATQPASQLPFLPYSSRTLMYWGSPATDTHGLAL